MKTESSLHLIAGVVIAVMLSRRQCDACANFTVANGNVRYSDRPIDPSHAVGSLATVTCDTGYQLVGPAKRTCQSDQTWSGSTSCLDVRAICKSIGGAFSSTTNSCFKFDNKTTDWFGAHTVCARLAPAGLRGRLAQPVTMAAFNLVISLVPRSKYPWIALRTPVSGSGNVTDWLWYEDATTAIKCMADTYIPAHDFATVGHQDCGYLSDKLFNTVCNSPTDSSSICEFLTDPAPVPNLACYQPKKATASPPTAVVCERNPSCVFPFVYKNNTYTECTFAGNMSKCWCSLNATYSGKWAFCTPTGSRSAAEFWKKLFRGEYDPIYFEAEDVYAEARDNNMTKREAHRIEDEFLCQKYSLCQQDIEKGKGFTKHCEYLASELGHPLVTPMWILKFQLEYAINWYCEFTDDHVGTCEPGPNHRAFVLEFKQSLIWAFFYTETFDYQLAQKNEEMNLTAPGSAKRFYLEYSFPELAYFLYILFILPLVVVFSVWNAKVLRNVLKSNATFYFHFALIVAGMCTCFGLVVSAKSFVEPGAFAKQSVFAYLILPFFPPDCSYNHHNPSVYITIIVAEVPMILSQLLLLLLAHDRYQALSNPLKYKIHCTRKRAVKYILGGLLSSFIYASLFIIPMRVMEIYYEDLVNTAFVNFFPSILFLLSLLALLKLQGSWSAKTYKSWKKHLMEQEKKSKDATKRKTQQLKISLKLLAAITVLNFVCYIPHIIGHISNIIFEIIYMLFRAGYIAEDTFQSWGGMFVYIACVKAYREAFYTVILVKIRKSCCKTAPTRTYTVHAFELKDINSDPRFNSRITPSNSRESSVPQLGEQRATNKRVKIHNKIGPANSRNKPDAQAVGSKAVLPPIKKGK